MREVAVFAVASPHHTQKVKREKQAGNRNTAKRLIYWILQKIKRRIYKAHDFGATCYVLS